MMIIPRQEADFLSLGPFRTGTWLLDLGWHAQKCVVLVRDRVLDSVT